MQAARLLAELLPDSSSGTASALKGFARYAKYSCTSSAANPSDLKLKSGQVCVDGVSHGKRPNAYAPISNIFHV
jgi:hypothetical protein